MKLIEIYSDEFCKRCAKNFSNKFKDKTSENVIAIDEILKSLKNKKAKNFYVYNKDIKVGGVCLLIDENTQNNSLELFYILEKFHSKGYDLTNNRKNLS